MNCVKLKNYIGILVGGCNNFLKINKHNVHVMFTNENLAYNKYIHFKNMMGKKNNNNKIVLIDIEKEGDKYMRRKINRSMIVGVLLTSLTIGLVELNVIPNLYGLFISIGIIFFYIIYFIFYNSIILRAVLDYRNKSLLLYPFMIFKRANLKKQIIISLYEIQKINKINNYIQIYLKKSNNQMSHKGMTSFFAFFNNIFPMHMPRYTLSKTTKEREKNIDILYPYDYNNLNISVFNKNPTSFKNIPTIKKTEQGYPLNLMEENNLIALLKL
ncbi:conserved Plasmodium protein, unknown function [Plasmodium berghei]|uniref:Uncharacterized protein n=2 Tax=Plasmodium berghei TaxID=5821 RepID=A0A509AJ00_PLABA|nr:conserved Plasmodium protein, unknown function [Plasmodium berghei ANKA]CXI36878.1 conserved Plasmodium protein, unknown function [Plasmodium berghei]SCM21629.1 conserved Plasmodium protein, unknown function [Plasmodium berghei]SCN24830.1 conserved Plasmodium protein, unknown function [Plasmodium berghei]SCO59950.1 conserved Plasmodium protein, unknown function [Plasmodium berghei]SCO61320.1 conserved Plasmodium protein, unknown function [Plasmodium berghei]|eukprot:XP_034421316.1 conserved Plasmodium protein, unknown function [Plasmodium berghei ANKA]